MIDSIFAMIGDSIYFVIQAFSNIVPSDFLVLILYAFMIYTVTRLLLIPFIGQGSSDVVRRSRKSNNKNNKDD